MRIAIAWLCVFACSKDDAARTPPPPPAPAPPISPACAKAIPPFLDGMYATLAKSPAAQRPGGERIAKTRAQLEPALLAECTASKWPESYLTCIATPKPELEMEACEHKLPAAARERGAKIVDDILEPVITKLSPGAAAPAPKEDDDH